VLSDIKKKQEYDSFGRKPQAPFGAQTAWKNEQKQQYHSNPYQAKNPFDTQTFRVNINGKWKDMSPEEFDQFMKYNMGAFDDFAFGGQVHKHLQF
jgi:hypothetical protein